MQSQDKKLAQQERSKDLYALSNQLFATAKTLTEYHTAELNKNKAYALSYAQTAAHQDITQLKALQSAVATEAAKRMGVYQAKVKVILDQMDGKTSDKHLKEARSILADWYKDAKKTSDKRLKEARSILANWYKDAKKKIPQGAEQLGQVAHEVADAGIKAFKAGRKLTNEAADAAEKSQKKLAKKEAIKATKEARSILADWYKDAKKKIPQGAEQLGQVAHEVADAGIKAFKATKATMKKPSVKKVVVKKVPAKKVSASITPPSKKLRTYPLASSSGAVMN
jgi:hypothetical protein